MIENYYSVEQISKLLDIHPKTIQRYIREGKLRAHKIGKAWRVSGHDLSLFTEQAPPAHRSDGLEKPLSSSHKSTASSVIDIHINSKNDAIRIINTLNATMNVKPREYGQASLHTQLIESENMVRITLWGEIRFVAFMMDTIHALVEPN